MNDKKNLQTDYNELLIKFKASEDENEKFRKAIIMFREQATNVGLVAQRLEKSEKQAQDKASELVKAKDTIKTQKKTIQDLETDIQTLHQRNEKLMALQQNQSTLLSDTNGTETTNEIMRIISALPKDIQSNVPSLLESTIKTFYPQLKTLTRDNNNDKNTNNKDDTKRDTSARKRAVAHRKKIAVAPLQDDDHIKTGPVPFKRPLKRPLIQTTTTPAAAAPLRNLHQEKKRAIETSEKVTEDMLLDKEMTMLDVACEAFYMIKKSSTLRTNNHISMISVVDNAVLRLSNKVHLEAQSTGRDTPEAFAVIFDMIVTAFMDCIVGCCSINILSAGTTGYQKEKVEVEEEEDVEIDEMEVVPPGLWFQPASTQGHASIPASLSSSLSPASSSIGARTFFTAWCESTHLRCNTLAWLLLCIHKLDEKLQGIYAADIDEDEAYKKTSVTPSPQMSLCRCCAEKLAENALQSLLLLLFDSINPSMLHQGKKQLIACTMTSACVCSAMAVALWRMLGDNKACHTFFIDCIGVQMVAARNVDGGSGESDNANALHQRQGEKTVLPVMVAAMEVWPEVLYGNGKNVLGSHVLAYMHHASDDYKNDYEGDQRDTAIRNGDRKLIDKAVLALRERKLRWGDGSRSLEKGKGKGGDEEMKSTRLYFSKFITL